MSRCSILICAAVTGPEKLRDMFLGVGGESRGRRGFKPGCPRLEERDVVGVQYHHTLP